MTAIESKAGKFITLEGMDGAGKSTALGSVVSYLQHHGFEVLTTREPGGTEFGEQMRQILLGCGQVNISDIAELLSIFAARAQHVQERIKPALACGKWVVCDRFTDATFAYQGGGRGIDWKHIAELERWTLGDFEPDLTLYLDVSIATGARRLGALGEPDRFEREDVKFKESVQAAYRRLWQESPGRIRRIDAEQNPAGVRKSIEAVLITFLGHNE